MKKKQFVSHFKSEIESLKICLIDDNRSFQAATFAKLKFHRSDATEREDSITSIIAKRTLQPTLVHAGRWRADHINQEETLIISKHQHSETVRNTASGLEASILVSPAIINDLNDADGAAKANLSQLEKIAEHQLKHYDLLAKEYSAQGTVRGIEVGTWFTLTGYEKVDGHQGSNNEYLIRSKTAVLQNNLPKDLNEQFNELLKSSCWFDKIRLTETERQSCILTLQRRHVPIVPAYDPLKDKPKATLMYARVVGEKGEAVYVDEWSRIKVRYVYTRAEDNSHDCGAASNNNDRDSAWVEVLTGFAGAGFGVRFPCRVGELVLIDHIGGDIDRPIVIGRVHESDRYPTQFDNKGKLPETRYLSGVRTEEIQASGFSQLRFDDTKGQISAQLQNSHGASQLNLGQLSHPKQTEKSDDRGEGFELRTDKWGAVRAGDGLLLSTYRQENADGSHMYAEEAKKQLENSYDNSNALSEVAKHQQSEELQSLKSIKAFAKQIEKDIAKLNNAVILLSSPEDIAISTAQNMHLSANGQINQHAENSINISTQKSLIAHVAEKLSLFAAKLGVKIFAGKGKVEIQAQNDGMDLFARKLIEIISTEDAIEIKAKKKIILTGDTSQIEINGQGIFSRTKGPFEVKSGQHSFKGAEQVKIEYPHFYENICIPCLLAAAAQGLVFIDK